MQKKLLSVLILAIALFGVLSSPATASSPVRLAVACVPYPVPGHPQYRAEFVLVPARGAYLSNVRINGKRAIGGGGSFIISMNYRNAHDTPRYGSRIKMKVKYDYRGRSYSKSYRVKVGYCEG